MSVVDISGDGKLVKKIIKEGVGEERPTPASEVSVHYVGKLLDGTVFDSSRDRNEQFKFKIGQGSVIKGWDQGVATMKRGEVALLTCSPEYAYGEAGSPPKIPPNSTLEFEVELFDWDSFTQVVPGVKKQILVEGEGYVKPNARATVHLDYRLAVLSDPSVVKLERTGASWVIGDDDSIPEGLEEAVRSMKKGERALIIVESRLGYGSGGNAELGIPPSADLRYEITLNDFQKAKDRWEMNVHEKIAAALAEKEKGNALFKAGRLNRAYKKYSDALDFIQYESDESEKTRIEEIKVTCNSNMSAVKLQKKEYSEVLKLVKKVLEIDSKNIKALYRKAVALLETGSPEESLEIVKVGLELDPENKNLKVVEVKAHRQIRAIRDKEKKAFGGMFSKWQGLVPEESVRTVEGSEESTSSSDKMQGIIEGAGEAERA